MPAIQKTFALAANERGNNPLEKWQYQYAPFNGLVRIGMNTTAAAGLVDVSIFTGSDNIVQNSDVSVGATAGVMPAPLNVPYFEFIVRQGDRITVSIDETGGATPTVNFFCAIDPV